MPRTFLHVHRKMVLQKSANAVSRTSHISYMPIQREEVSPPLSLFFMSTPGKWGFTSVKVLEIVRTSPIAFTRSPS